ncbi:MAG: TonB-dependent receptor [Chitinophagales bacterium]
MKSIPSKIFLLFCFLLVHYSHSFAQASLSGKVTNAKDGQPLAGATVYIPDLKNGVAADKDGIYSLKNIPKGTYVVTARSIGHAQKTETVKVEGNTAQDFSLEESETEMQEVVVTGNSLATDMDQTPAPVTQIPNSYLLQNASTNIIDALAKVPGVSGITDGQSISKPVIRGLGYNRVVTVADGVPQEGQQWGDEFGIEVDPNSVDRVEILKGPASLAYGSDAISGVVNLIPEQTLPEGQISGGILYNYQTNNGLNNLTGHVAGNKGGVAWSARMSSIMSHSYQNKYDGYVFNSQFSNFAYDGTLGIHKDWGYSQLHYSYFDLKTGIVEGARDSATGNFVKQVLVDDEPADAIATDQELKSYTPFLINQNVRHYKLVWDNSVAVGSGRITGLFAWQQNRRQENNDITIPNTSNIYYFLNTLNYDVRYLFPEVNNFNLSIGVNGMYQNSKNKGTLLLIPEYNLFDLGGFAIASKQFGHLNLSAGVRYDVRPFTGHDNYIDSSGNELSPDDPAAIHRFTGYTSNYNGFSGSIGGTYQFTKSVYLKANVARGFRAPNVAESGSNGIHDGTVVYEIGDPNLKPENSLEFDIAPGINSKDVTAEVDLFINSIDNFIYPQQLKNAAGGDSIDNSTPGFPDAPVFKYTQDKAQLTGGEAVLDIHPSAVGWLDFYAGYSIVNAQLVNHPDSTKYLPFIPPAKLRTEVTVTFKDVNKTFANLYLRFGLNHYFSQKNVYQQTQIYYALPEEEAAASTSPSDAYTLLNAAIGSDIMTHGHKALSIYFSVDNLADVAYKDYMSRFKYYEVNFASDPHRVGVYNMGRNFSIKLVVPLDFTK